MRGQLILAALAAAAPLVFALPQPARAYFLLVDTNGGEVCSDGACNGSNAVAQILYGTGSPSVVSSGVGSACYVSMCYVGGQNIASINLATGKLETYASSNYATIGVADAQIGAPIMISGSVSGNVTLTMYVTGSYSYNSNSSAAVTAYLELFDPNGSADSVATPVDQQWSASSTQDPGFGTFSYELQATVPVDTLLGFEASISLETGNSAVIDASNTTTFGLSLPAGDTYSSPFSFIGPETAVPEPGSLLTLLSGLGGILAVLRRRPRSL